MSERFEIKKHDIITGNDGDPYIRINSQRGKDFDETKLNCEQLKTQVHQDFERINRVIKRLEKTDQQIEEYHKLASTFGLDDAHKIACANMNREKRDAEIKLQSELMNIMDDII